MSEPSNYLLDELISFAEEQKTSIEKAAGLLANLAKQRLPERKFEQATVTARAKFLREIKASKKEYFISRVIMVSRIHAIAWTYYPKYHLVSLPTKFTPGKYTWFSIRWERLNWKPVTKKNHYFLDDLFFDPDEGRFWMHEPYLAEIKISKQVYAFLADKNAPCLTETNFKKIDPKMVEAFKNARSNIPEFKVQFCTSDKIHKSQPYGSRGWKKRIEVIPRFERRGWR
jgi:hypothetical protein